MFLLDYEFEVGKKVKFYGRKKYWKKLCEYSLMIEQFLNNSFHVYFYDFLNKIN